MFPVLSVLVCALVVVLWTQPILSIEKYGIGELEVNLGENVGLKESSTIPHETLQKILAGVENGNKDNIYYFGLLKMYGISVSKDLTMAAENFRRASSLGHKEGTTAYGVMLMTGNGIKQDLITATKYFRRGVELGDMNAHWLLGKVLLDSRSTNNPPYAEAAALFRVAAEENVPQALHSLALLYEYGLGVEQNFEEARSLYAQAVEQHHVESMYNLAMMYAQGRGMPQDFPRARTLLEGAAQTNHAPSIYYIGVFKTYGYGCQVEYNQAINWFERAAGLDDYRVSAKAAKAAQELRTKVDAANLQNEQLLDKYQERAQVSGR